MSLTKRAPVWKFFHSNEEKKLAKCQVDKCYEIINWKNGLSGLSNHLNLISKYPLIQVSKKHQYARYPSIRISEKSGIRPSLVLSWSKIDKNVLL